MFCVFTRTERKIFLFPLKISIEKKNWHDSSNKSGLHYHILDWRKKKIEIDIEFEAGRSCIIGRMVHNLFYLIEEDVENALENCAGRTRGGGVTTVPAGSGRVKSSSLGRIGRYRCVICQFICFHVDLPARFSTWTVLPFVLKVFFLFMSRWYGCCFSSISSLLFPPPPIRN